MIGRADYFHKLFNPGEATCFAWRNKDTAVLPVERFDGDQLSPWVCLNPLHIDLDNDADTSSLPWSRPDLGRRADVNVSAHRNILLEMDDVPLVEQWPLIKASYMPFTTSVYSGKKSIHFVISLVDPVSRPKYDELVEMVYTALRVKVDAACRNPSRLTRAPGVVRADTGKEQRLLEVRERVPYTVVHDWCVMRGALPAPPRPAQRPVYAPGTRPPWLVKLLAEGAANGGRNAAAFRLACALARTGSTEDEIVAELRQSPGIGELSDRELRDVARKGVRRAR